MTLSGGSKRKWIGFSSITSTLVTLGALAGALGTLAVAGNKVLEYAPAIVSIREKQESNMLEIDARTRLIAAAISVLMDREMRPEGILQTTFDAQVIDADSLLRKALQNEMERRSKALENGNNSNGVTE